MQYLLDTCVAKYRQIVRECDRRSCSDCLDCQAIVKEKFKV
ncbi:hypothetical protein [Dolichospermum sp. LEGE 00246]|nr:hypothetical protein [Dolichospermum sp. LEGE 00246]